MDSFKQLEQYLALIGKDLVPLLTQCSTEHDALKAANRELSKAVRSLLEKFVTKEFYPEFIRGQMNDLFIDMAICETLARAALAKHEPKPEKV